MIDFPPHGSIMLMHDPAHDVAEVLLEHVVGEPAEPLTVELER